MIPTKAMNMIIGFEGLDQPWRWPGGESGITIGYGYDLGYEENFEKDWAGLLNWDQIDALKAALGKTGHAAQAIAGRFRDITITTDQALQVFQNKTLPHYEQETALAFPGIDKLPDLARGALVSLVYNRGADMTGPRRIEMRTIRNAIATLADGKTELAACVKTIALMLRSMKRLWIGKGLDGLLKRREAEAAMVEEALA